MKKITKLFCVFAIAALMAGCKQNADDEVPGTSDSAGTQQDSGNAGGSSNSGNSGNTGNGGSQNNGGGQTGPNVGVDELKGITYGHEYKKWVFNSDGTVAEYYNWGNDDNPNWKIEYIYSYNYNSNEKTFTIKVSKVNVENYGLGELGMTGYLTKSELESELENLFTVDAVKGIIRMLLDPDFDGEGPEDFIAYVKSKHPDAEDLNDAVTDDELIELLAEYTEDDWEDLNFTEPVSTWEDVAEQYQSVMAGMVMSDFNMVGCYGYKFIDENKIEITPLVATTNFKDYFSCQDEGEFILVANDYNVRPYLRWYGVEIEGVYYSFDEVTDTVIKAQKKIGDNTPSSVEIQYTADFSKPQGEKTVTLTIDGENYSFKQTLGTRYYDILTE